MDKMTLGRLFKLYYDIFDKFGLHLLQESDENIGYIVFELTDISIGFSSKRILTKLLDEGIIDESIFKLSLSLHDMYRSTIRIPLLRNVQSVRNEDEWKELMVLSEDIRTLLTSRWSNEEMIALYELSQPISFNID